MQAKVDRIRASQIHVQTINHNEINALQNSIDTFQEQASHILPVPHSKNERFWVLTREAGLTGFFWKFADPKGGVKIFCVKKQWFIVFKMTAQIKLSQPKNWEKCKGAEKLV